MGRAGSWSVCCMHKQGLWMCMIAQTRSGCLSLSLLEWIKQRPESHVLLGHFQEFLAELSKPTDVLKIYTLSWARVYVVAVVVVVVVAVVVVVCSCHGRSNRYCLWTWKKTKGQHLCIDYLGDSDTLDSNHGCWVWCELGFCDRLRCWFLFEFLVIT